MSNSCIRVYADPKQISRCKTQISGMEAGISKMAEVLGLTGNSVRLKILLLLKQEGKMCPCDLSDILNMTVPAVSQHLKKLKDGELVYSEKTGQTIFYSITTRHTQVLEPVLGLLSSQSVRV